MIQKCYFDSPSLKNKLELSFNNDFWRLNPDTSYLVRMFPLDFWFEVTLAVGVLTVIQGFLVAIGGYGYLLWDDYRQDR